ncbi:MAG TPA: argininosuccinate lyase [Thermoanaerobaculia bacterium]|nr:argininosuccinate lyase [Thermoanaerobaculia bacterium]
MPRAGVPRRDLWGSRFASGPSEALRRFNDSFGFDRELLPHDVAGSIAWSGALRHAGAITSREERRLVRSLRRVAARGVPADAGEHEDVHSFVEASIRRSGGAAAGKLHTGRSRNDQVATDLRLWLRDAFAEARRHGLALAAVLARRAEAEAGTAMPGYTHGRRAEPVTFGHWCLAYVEMLRRDAARFREAAARSDECPLGSGALSGSPVAIDRFALARTLGFARPTANSLDAVSDRDGAADYLHAAALHLSHLSRLAEDLIFFSSDEAGFVELPDALATGSSRLPHKKNPDVLELVRGHAGRAAGELAGFLALLKGLPLAYDKDLQLDKEPLFRMRAVLAAALPALTALLEGLRLDRARMRAAAEAGPILATELADALAARGVPFRKAHALVGRRVAAALASGRSLRDLPASVGITSRDLAALDLDRALARRRVHGGTSPSRVRQAARAARRALRAEGSR